MSIKQRALVTALGIVDHVLGTPIDEQPVGIRKPIDLHFGVGTVVAASDRQYVITKRGTTLRLDAQGQQIKHEASMTLRRQVPKVRGKAARKAAKRARHA